jgi:hypothetical protein
MRVATSLVFSAVMFLAAGSSSPAPAQAVTASQGKIDVTYKTPTNPKLIPVMERLKARRVLEQLSEFAAPLRLPHELHLIAKECHVVNAFYSPRDWSLTLCYEIVDTVSRDAPKASELKAGLKPEDVIRGEVTFVILHELAHAAFDMFQVPVFGREEDAADQMGVFLAMQFSPDVERTITLGNFYFFNERDPANWGAYADEHGTDSQRRYNGLCWAYGGDPHMFKDYVDQGLLPQGRAKGCIDEYQRIRDAFNRTILPFIDEKSMNEVQTRNWFQSAAGDK